VTLAALVVYVSVLKLQSDPTIETSEVLSASTAVRRVPEAPLDLGLKLNDVVPHEFDEGLG